MKKLCLATAVAAGANLAPATGIPMNISWKLEVKTADGSLQTVTPENLADYPDLRVEVAEKGEKSKLLCRNIPAGLTVTKMIYPAFKIELDDDLEILLPESQGLKVSKIQSHPAFSFKPEDPDYVVESRFRSLQFAAIMRKGGGLYIGVDDGGKRISKSADLYRSTDREQLFLDIVAVMPITPGARELEQPFETTLRPFSGNWFEAATIYKSGIPANRPLRPNSRMRDIGFWLWNRDRASWVIPPVLQLQKDSGVPVALDWYWYHQRPYDTGYPDYYPPREGVEKFTSALAELDKAGVFTQVYTNGFLWDTCNDDWQEGGEEGVILDENGKMVATAFNVYLKHDMAYMCGTAKKFQRKLLGEIEKLAACGLRGIYVDMIGCATMQFCYNPAHPHLPGGGNYMAEGYRAMLDELHRRLPELYISTEDCNEIYMDKVDSVISIMSPSGERYGFGPPFEFVPAFSAVHHGDGLAVYGSNAHIDGVPPFDTLWPQEGKWKREEDWNAIAPYQFFVELGRCVIWGQQPMVANLRPEHLTDPKLADRYDFICHTARFYYDHRRFLYDGEMLNPGELECRAAEVKFIVRYIFTEEGNYRTVSRTMPAVLHSVWRSPDGEEALILLNYTETPQSFTFRTGDRAPVSGTVPAQSFELRKL